jgi:hypothetical protein
LLLLVHSGLLFQELFVLGFVINVLFKSTFCLGFTVSELFRVASSLLVVSELASIFLLLDDLLLELTAIFHSSSIIVQLELSSDNSSFSIVI